MNRPPIREVFCCYEGESMRLESRGNDENGLNGYRDYWRTRFSIGLYDWPRGSGYSWVIREALNRNLAPNTEKGRGQLAEEIGDIMSQVIPAHGVPKFKEELEIAEVASRIGMDPERAGTLIEFMTNKGLVVSRNGHPAG